MQHHGIPARDRLGMKYGDIAELERYHSLAFLPNAYSVRVHPDMSRWIFKLIFEIIPRKTNPILLVLIKKLHLRSYGLFCAMFTRLR